MKVIIANINGHSLVSRFEEYKLRSACWKWGLDKPIRVHTPLQLIETLEKYEDHNPLLFSNFPPNSSYPGSGKKLQVTDKGDYIKSYWEADSYSKSTALFEKMLSEYFYVALHFITGAPEEKLGEEHLKSLVPHTLTTVTRKGTFKSKRKTYNQLYCRFISKKITEAVEGYSFA